MKQRIIELEKKVSFQDAEIKDLGNAVMLQHKKIEALRKNLTVLQDKIKSGALVKDINDEEPPPHY